MADKTEYNYKEIQERIKSHSLGGAFLLYGDEPYYMDWCCREIKKATVGDDVLNYTKYTTMPDMGDLITNCTGFPMFSEYKLIIVNDSGLFSDSSNSATRDELVSLLEELPETTILIFRESKVTKTLKTYKTVLSTGTVIACTKETEDSIKKFLAGYARKSKRGITKDAADLMYIGIGNDISRLRAEMDKLILYKNEGEIIDEEDVRAVCKLSISVKIWELTDAVMSGKKEKALIYLQALIDERTPATIIFSTITKMYLDQYNVKTLVEQGMTTDAAAAKLGLRPFIAKNYYRALKAVPASVIAKKADYSIELTEDVRNGKISELYALSLLVSG